MGDGELRFKTSLDASGEPVAPALIQHLLDANLAHMNKYLRGLMGVAYGELEPGEAVRRCEAKVEEDEGPADA